MDRVADKKSASQYLYPPIDPYDQRMLNVGDGHRVYVEQCGNPDGIPVVVLHGGPPPGPPAILTVFPWSYCTGGLAEAVALQCDAILIPTTTV